MKQLHIHCEKHYVSAQINTMLDKALLVVNVIKVHGYGIYITMSGANTSSYRKSMCNFVCSRHEALNFACIGMVIIAYSQP